MFCLPREDTERTVKNKSSNPYHEDVSIHSVCSERLIIYGLLYMTQIKSVHFSRSRADDCDRSALQQLMSSFTAIRDLHACCGVCALVYKSVFVYSQRRQNECFRSFAIIFIYNNYYS